MALNDLLLSRVAKSQVLLTIPTSSNSDNAISSRRSSLERTRYNLDFKAYV